MRLKQLNDCLQADAGVDAEAGDGNIVMQLDVKDGELTGDAKPLFRHVTFFSGKHVVEQQHDNPLQLLWEGLAGGAENVLKNQRANQFATRVEFSGRTDQPQTSTTGASLRILRTAFIEAYKQQFEKKLSEPFQDRKSDANAAPQDRQTDKERKKMKER